MNQQPFQFALDSSAVVDRMIEDALMGRVGAYPLSDKGRELLHILAWHKGASHAKPLAEIAEKLHVSDRALKALVKELIENFGVVIGSSRQEPYGYFLCVTEEDRKAALRPLIHEIQSLSRRARTFDHNGRLSEILGQLQLEIDKAS